MLAVWPELALNDWRESCDTLHAHTQVLGKLAVVLAPPEPRVEHTALRLTARGWETKPLPAPDGSGALVAVLDLHAHEAVIEHSDGRGARVPLTPDRPVGAVTRELLADLAGLVGAVEINPKPQEVPWSVPLDEDEEHHTYDRGAVERYHAAATSGALVLAGLRAQHTGTSTPVNAWWGSFDLAVSLFAPRPPGAPGEDIEVAVGWWPGDQRHESTAFYAYANPAPDGLSSAVIEPAPARWDAGLGEFLLGWDDVRAEADPYAAALSFGRSVYRAASTL
jgi:hypothetical protein